MQVADLRTSYEKGALSEADVASDPIAQFDRWFKDAVAAGMPEPNCMTLATVGADGRPSTRIVLIKGYDLAATPPGASERGFVWYTNFESRKGQDIAVHPHAALQFHWIGLERQVRIEGLVEQATAAEADAYFASRPLGSRIGAWASPQSQLIPDREVLERREAEMKQRFGDVVPRPPHWGGYRLVPDYVEFWQGRPSRLHDRLVYRREGSHWTLGRLAP